MISGNRRGFTLIEMLVAVVVFLVFVSAVYGTYSAAHRAIVQVQAREDLYQTGRVLLAQLNSEITCAYQSPDAVAPEFLGEETEGGDAGLQADRLTLLTTAHRLAEDELTGGLCRVSYMMNDSTDDRPGLYLEVTPRPGVEMADETPVRRLLSPLVVGFNCKYLPADGDWETSWEGQATLPVAVRVELTLQPEDPGEKPIVLATTANLRMATAPAASETDGQ